MYPYQGDPVTQPAPFYEAGADLLDRDGWIQGFNHVAPEEVDPSVAFLQRSGWCAAAAINHVAGRGLSDRSDDLFTPLADWLFMNRPEEVRAGLCASREVFDRVVGERAAGSDVTREIGLPLDVVRAWNDRHSTTRFGIMGRFFEEALPGRTKEDVVAALRECAAALAGTT